MMNCSDFAQMDNSLIGRSFKKIFWGQYYWYMYKFKYYGRYSSTRYKHRGIQYVTTSNSTATATVCSLGCGLTAILRGAGSLSVLGHVPGRENVNNAANTLTLVQYSLARVRFLSREPR